MDWDKAQELSSASTEAGSGVAGTGGASAERSVYSGERRGVQRSLAEAGGIKAGSGGHRRKA